MMLGAFKALQIEQYLSVAGIAALVYNHLLTFEWEVQYYIRGRWGFARVVFVICRYLPYAGAALATKEALLSYVANDPRSHVSCSDVLAKISRKGNYVRIVSLLSAEVLLNIRIWALWEKNKWILVTQILTAAIALPLGLFFNMDTLRLPKSYTYNFCAYQVGVGALLVSGVIIAYELVLFFLVLLRCRQLKNIFGFLPRRPNDTKSMLELVIQDGIFYFFAIVAVSATIVITGFTLGGEYSAILETFQIMIHSSMSCGAILHIVENDKKGRETVTSLDQLISLQIRTTSPGPRAESASGLL